MKQEQTTGNVSTKRTTDRKRRVKNRGDGEKNDKANKDKRQKLVDATMRRYGYSSFALIETLHTVQEAYGYLDDEHLKYVARSLRVPLSKVYGVATFYHFFTLKPQGEHTAVVCTGTACYIKGVPAIFDAIRKNFNVEPGETTEDRRLSVLTARCIGSCGLAPAVVFDGKISGHLTPESVTAKIRELTGNENGQGETS